MGAGTDGGVLPALRVQGQNGERGPSDEGWGQSLQGEAVSPGGCWSPVGGRGGVMPHLVVPCTGDELL